VGNSTNGTKNTDPTLELVLSSAEWCFRLGRGEILLTTLTKFVRKTTCYDDFIFAMEVQ